MNFLIQFFNIVLYQPLLNILILFYLYLPGRDFGVAIILLTILIKLILLPSSLEAIQSQRALINLQPKIKEIQKRYKDNREEQSRAFLDLYKKEKINPFASFLPLLLQIPIFIALYKIFLTGLDQEVLKKNLYRFIPVPKTINLNFLGIIDLTRPNFLMALLAGILQFIQSKFSLFNKKTDKKDAGQIIQSQMTYLISFLTVFIVWKLGSIIGLYWITSTLFSIGEQYIINAKVKSQKSKV